MDTRLQARRRTSIPEPEFIDDAKPEDLNATELFKGVPADAISEIQKASRIVVLKPTQSLYTAREGVDYLYIILKGYVSIWIPPAFDPKLDEVFLAWRGPQQIIGELRKRGDALSDTIITTYEECVFIEIRLDAFGDLADTLCLLYQNVASLVWKKIWYEGRRSEVVQMNPARRQIAQTLINLAEDRCPDFSFKQVEYVIPGIIHQDELAGYAGITRKSAHEQMKFFREQGFVSYQGKKGSQITIRNLHRLQEIISPEVLSQRLIELGLEPPRHAS